MSTPTIDEENLTERHCEPLASLTRPVEVGEIGYGRAGNATFFQWPFLGPLLFDNESSDARDHCANERTFLSYLRLSVYMAIVSVAMTLSFHLKHQPTDLERRMATPLGAIFWVLALLMLVLGVANYIKTVNLYSEKAAIVQSGRKTQVILGLLAACIFGTCMVLVVVTRMRRDDEDESSQSVGDASLR